MGKGSLNPRVYEPRMGNLFDLGIAVGVGLAAGLWAILLYLL
jgi:hypothetical protein